MLSMNYNELPGKTVDIFIDRLDAATRKAVIDYDPAIEVTVDRYVKEGRGGCAAATIHLNKEENGSSLSAELCISILEIGWSWSRLGVTIIARGGSGFIPIYSRIDNDFDKFFEIYFPRIIQNSINRLSKTNHPLKAAVKYTAAASEDDYVSTIQKWKRKAKDILSFSKNTKKGM